MNANIFEFVLEGLDRRTPAWAEIARATGVPYNTLKKIATRTTPNPGVKHVQTLANYFAGRQDPVAQNTPESPSISAADQAAATVSIEVSGGMVLIPERRKIIRRSGFGRRSTDPKPETGVSAGQRG